MGRPRDQTDCSGRLAMKENEMLVIAVSSECFCQATQYSDGHWEIWHCEFHRLTPHLLKQLRSLTDNVYENMARVPMETRKELIYARNTIERADNCRQRSLRKWS